MDYTYSDAPVNVDMDMSTNAEIYDVETGQNTSGHGRVPGTAPTVEDWYGSGDQGDPAATEDPPWEGEYEVGMDGMIGNHHDNKDRKGYLQLDEQHEFDPWQITTAIFSKSGDKKIPLNGFIDTGNTLGSMITLSKLLGMGYRESDIDFSQIVNFETLGGDVQTFGVVKIKILRGKRYTEETFHVIGDHPSWLGPDGICLALPVVTDLGDSKMAEAGVVDDQLENLPKDWKRKSSSFEEQPPEPYFTQQETPRDDGPDTIRIISPSPPSSISSEPSAVVSESVWSSNQVQGTNPTSVPPAATAKDNSTASREHNAATIASLNDDTKTIYSDFSDSHNASFEGYVKALAYELFKGLKDVCEVDTSHGVDSQVLTDRLRTFALRLGQDSKDRMHQDIKVFVHKRRRYVGGKR